jgi:hypothetical protein
MVLSGYIFSDRGSGCNVRQPGWYTKHERQNKIEGKVEHPTMSLYVLRWFDDLDMGSMSISWIKMVQCLSILKWGRISTSSSNKIIGDTMHQWPLLFSGQRLTSYYLPWCDAAKDAQVECEQCTSMYVTESLQVTSSCSSHFLVQFMPFTKCISSTESSDEAITNGEFEKK